MVALEDSAAASVPIPSCCECRGSNGCMLLASAGQGSRWVGHSCADTVEAQLTQVLLRRCPPQTHMQRQTPTTTTPSDCCWFKLLAGSGGSPAWCPACSEATHNMQTRTLLLALAPLLLGQAADGRRRESWVESSMLCGIILGQYGTMRPWAIGGAIMGLQAMC